MEKALCELSGNRQVSVENPRLRMTWPPNWDGGLILKFVNGDKLTSVPVSREAGAALVSCLLQMYPQGYAYPAVKCWTKETQNRNEDREILDVIEADHLTVTQTDRDTCTVEDGSGNHWVADNPRAAVRKYFKAQDKAQGQ